MKLQGIFIPVAIPFDYRGEVYKIKLQHNIEKWNRTSIAGFVVSGAESIYLSAAEKIEVWEWAAQSAAPDKLLLADTGMPGVHETLELTGRAASLGYKAALIRSMDPIYIRATADRATIPLVLETDLPQAGHPNAVHARIATSAAALAESFAAGASAAIVDFANAAPYAAIAIWEAHRTRDHEAALDWQKRIAPAAELISAKYGIAGLKHAMDLNGYYGGLPRLPLTGLTPEAKREIEQAFDGIKS